MYLHVHCCVSVNVFTVVCSHVKWFVSMHVNLGACECRPVYMSAHV